MLKEKLIYVYPSKSTFILRDIKMLNNEFDVLENYFDVSNKKKVPIKFITQFFFLIKNIKNSKGVICHFAGYSSFLPSILSKLFKKPCLIIVAGTDASKFPDFNYGNFTKSFFAYFTGESLRRASHILPVHESLYFQNYDYYDGGKPAQGYSFFYPKAKNVPFTPVYYAYDSAVFKIKLNSKRKKNSFITIGNLADKYCFKRKGYDIILELAAIQKDCIFTIVGTNEDTNMIVPENVKLLPYKNQDEIIDLFNEHEFYLQLSIMEGFPNALAEAMLCGCIPIGSNVSGIPYIVKDTGFILKKRDIIKLNEIFNLILELEEEKRKELCILARNRVESEFTIENRKSKILNILNLKIK
jgi:glycosyltransferase involved in cell wall biosynthesis